MSNDDIILDIIQGKINIYIMIYDRKCKIFGTNSIAISLFK